MLAAVALVGCNREDTPVSPQEQHVIGFGSVDTRADKSVLQRDGFDVWATVSSIGSTSVSYQPILTGEHVTHVSGDEWYYQNEQMWIPNSIFHFFAAYPHDLDIEQMMMAQNGVNYTAYALDVAANGGAATEDILIAQHVTNTSDAAFNPDAVVDLSFGHLLTKVNVKIRQNFDIDPDFNYYVKKITLSGIKGNGTYMIMPYNKSWFTYWNFDNAANISIEKDFSDNPVLLRNEGAANPIVILTVWDDGLMLIPQDFVGSSIAVRVDYFYDVNLDDDDMGGEKFVEGYIPAGAWESGKSVNYTLAIANSSFITFEQPTIDPWGSPQTGGTIIIQ